MSSKTHLKQLLHKVPATKTAMERSRDQGAASDSALLIRTPVSLDIRSAEKKPDTDLLVTCCCCRGIQSREYSCSDMNQTD